MKWLKGLLINLQFFTSIPISINLPMDRDHLEKAIRTFPLVGLFQGSLYAFMLYAFLEWTPFSILAAAFAVWLAGIVLTGGIHLDGWMDAGDAFFSYRDQKKRLEIMSDPRTGAFGVLSVIVLLGARFLFIYEIANLSRSVSYFLIALIPFFGKMMMGILLLKVKAAKEEGLGYLFQQSASSKTLHIYSIYLLLMAGTAGFLVEPALFGLLLMILISVLLFFFLSKKVKTWFGGMTGDVLGASVEGTEVLLWMALWILHYFAMG
ncbi:adenosylcobinamide-GDP ribazoletransferase [Bacillus sp. ISL-47]|uniref:adenosylcobinamide-GDP ribazoletransferase n=1 Tax=Bacillus sp. ISL-47 TaxID=2819130 RepID=UPI001BEBFDC2|nr:adenosylcobinamide-GDP ribazoletransferase [Bacillus sp. ISL-47]MBT2689177.1 adenosylcobinamide-GDP ribazoletransferase [Bacillus sp. ISL-47]MBT2710293.1 adenosylcobinamide-GDP ribazoletransferase [Pseudomonas sp. ISL-84]